MYCVPIYHTYTLTFVVSKVLHFMHRDADKCFVTGEHGVIKICIYIYIYIRWRFSCTRKRLWVILGEYNVPYCSSMPVPVTARSKAWVCGRSPAGIAGSNSAWGINVSCECCLLSGRGLCDGLITRSEGSYRVWRVLVWVWVWVWSLHNEEPLDYWGLLHHGKK